MYLGARGSCATLRAMTLWRTISVSAVTVACCALTACGGESAGTGDAGSSAAAPSTSSQVSSAAETPTVEPAPVAAPVAAPVPAGPEAPPMSPAEVPIPRPAAPEPVAAAPDPVDARSPDQVVAESGDKGQRYLGALRAAGIPPAGMDAQEILYAQGLCRARAEGASRAELLREFDAVGQAYSTFTPLSAGQVAEAYVVTAERHYC